MKVKEYVDFAHFENDPHRQDVDLICIGRQAERLCLR